MSTWLRLACVTAMLLPAGVSAQEATEITLSGESYKPEATRLWVFATTIGLDWSGFPSTSSTISPRIH
jgi:hypothetical protein